MPIIELKLLAKKKLGFEINIDFPYKLCDYKPAYGYLFLEYIQDYDFWGHSDIDLIYGDIRSFLNENVLSYYDFISVRHDYTTGCFALYRNNNLMNTLFMLSKDYIKVFTDPIHYCFDECNFAWDELTEGKTIFEVTTEIESFTHVIKLAEKRNVLKAHFDFILMEGIPGRLRFENGKILYKNKYEVILYHLYWLKQVVNPTNFRKKIPNKYFISKSKIY